MPRTIAITGSSGLIGKALAGHLAARGDLVVALVRRPPRTSAEREWDPSNERLDPTELRDVITELAEDLYAFKDWAIGEYSDNAELNQRIWRKYPGF